MVFAFVFQDLLGHICLVEKECLSEKEKKEKNDRSLLKRKPSRFFSGKIRERRNGFLNLEEKIAGGGALFCLLRERVEEDHDTKKWSGCTCRSVKVHLKRVGRGTDEKLSRKGEARRRARRGRGRAYSNPNDVSPLQRRIWGPRLLLVNCAWLPTRFLVTSNATPRRVCRLPRPFFPSLFLKLSSSLSLSLSPRHE